jgi:phosphatidylserine/phosphatidylglycerophosphate/cardiolipin synthase-like enzyme
MLKAARKSIYIEQQYIRGSQPDIAILLDAIKAAMAKAPDLDVRIILGKVFSKKDLPKEKKNNDLLQKKYKLKVGRNIRYINTDVFVHCHNKMILVDGKDVLVSSQNWSDSAVSKNREAGIWLTHPGVCGYFSAIFENDWASAKKDPMGKGKPTVEPEALARGGYVRVVPADYQEV